MTVMAHLKYIANTQRATQLKMESMEIKEKEESPLGFSTVICPNGLVSILVSQWSKGEMLEVCKPLITNEHIYTG